MTMPANIRPTLVPVPDRLVGERVLLRPYREDDAPSVFAAIDEARGHLAPWMGWGDSHRSVDDTRDYCLRMAASWLLRSALIVGIFDKADGRYLGGAGFHEPDWDGRTFEVGYWLRPSALGHGYVTEAVRLLVGLAFGQLDARRVDLWCDATNERSRNVAERCGFVFEGRLRNRSLTPDGQPRDDFVFSLVPGDPAADPAWSPE